MRVWVSPKATDEGDGVAARRRLAIRKKRFAIKTL